MANKNRNFPKIKRTVLKRCRSPALVHLRPPTVIHATPQEFMQLVQRLTGKEGPIGTLVSPSSSSSISALKTDGNLRGKRDSIRSGVEEGSENGIAFDMAN